MFSFLQTRLFPGLLIVLALASGCRKKIDREVLDSDIRIRLIETLGVDRTLRLMCSTERRYGCLYGIDHDLYIDPERIRIDFHGVAVSDACLTAIGPASAILDLGSIANGTHLLDIRVRRSRTIGQLFVSDASYRIELLDPEGLHLLTPVLQRIPPNTIWGRVGYHAASTASLAQSFVDSLHTLGAQPAALPPGQYAHFEIAENGNMVTSAMDGYYFRIPYVLQYESDHAALEALVMYYGQNHGDLVSIVLHTAEGTSFRSWMY